MKWYYICAITLSAYWLVGCVIALFDKEEWLYIYAMGLLYPVLYILLYPIRAWKSYNSYRIYYEKDGISWMQYLFGKRRNR